MSILDTLKDKAAALWGNKEALLNRATPIYDATRNKIFVAGLELDGVVNAMLSPRTRTKAEQGLGHGYYAYYDAQEAQTFVIEVLPTAKCNDLISALADAQERQSGWFHLTIYENGVIKDLMRAHLISTTDIHLTYEPNNKSYVFGVVIVTPTVTMSNTTEAPVETPVAIEVQDYKDGLPVSETQPVQPQYINEQVPVQWEKGMP